MDQVHIRDAETVALLRTLARQTGRSMKDVMRDALHDYAARAAGPPADPDRVARSLALLRKDQEDVLPGAGSIDALLYGSDGLPR